MYDSRIPHNQPRTLLHVYFRSQQKSLKLSNQQQDNYIIFHGTDNENQGFRSGGTESQLSFGQKHEYRQNVVLLLLQHVRKRWIDNSSR